MSKLSAWVHCGGIVTRADVGTRASLALALAMGLSACTDAPPAPSAGLSTAAASGSISSSPAPTPLMLYPDLATLSVPPENPNLASAGFLTTLQLDARGSGALSAQDLVWRSSNPELVQVDAMGLVSITRSSGGAKPTAVPVTITAMLRQDPSRVATASIALTDEGTLILQPEGVPYSANSAILSLYYADGRPMLKQTLSPALFGTRLSDQVFMRLKASLGARVVGMFYREANPTAASTPIAMGVGTVNTYANNLNIYPLAVDAVTRPTLAVVSPGYGGVGQVVTLSGANFGHTASLPCAARFAGVSAVINRVSDQTVTATVPPGAVNGDLDLSVDGIKTTLSFKVLTKLAFSNPLWAYQYRQFALTGTFSDGSTGSVNAVTWSSSNPSVAVVDQNGLVRDMAPGTTTIQAASGQVVVAASVTVFTVGGVVMISVTVLPAGSASLSVPVTMPAAAPGLLPVVSSN